MNNKIKLTIEIIAIVALILIVVNLVKNNSSSNEENIETEIQNSDIQYNEISGEYYIEDEETGEVLHTGYSEDELYIYSIDPDYEVWTIDGNVENGVEEENSEHN